MKDRYDKKAKVREFKCGDKVLVYHCVPGSPLREKFMGPYKIIRWTTKTKYVIATPDRRKPTQLVHVNLIKPYHESTTGIVNHVIHDSKSAKQSMSLTPLDHRSQNEMQNEVQTPTKVGTDVSHEDDETDFSVKSTLSWKDMNNSEILKSLPRFLDCSPNQKKDLSILLSKYASICSDRPGSCTKVKHDLVLEPNTNPIRQSFYRVSHRHLPILKQEVEYLLEHNLAEPSTSPWASPCILVDASNIGFGGVLLQEIASDGAVSLPLLERLLPIAYHSGFFKGSQLRWATVEKELFSIINTVLHFRPYLEGLDNVVVYSDHMPLSFLHRAKFTNQKLLRWSYILSSFNIEVRKISGSRNTIADALSRQPRLQRS
ncbi:uncharacterized protein [Palaemon carinicauda]|uniref:uncharacterized protein n=1 Tax=Palaemon carinicauda TaxID=392227 RepID=UPI0035B659FF